MTQVRNCGWCGEAVEGRGEHRLCVEALADLARDHEAAANAAWIKVGQILLQRIRPVAAA